MGTKMGLLQRVVGQRAKRVGVGGGVGSQGVTGQGFGMRQHKTCCHKHNTTYAHSSCVKNATCFSFSQDTNHRRCLLHLLQC